MPREARPDPPVPSGPGGGSRSCSLAPYEWEETGWWGQFSQLPALNQNSPCAKCRPSPAASCTTRAARSRDAPGQAATTAPSLPERRSRSRGQWAGKAPGRLSSSTPVTSCPRSHPLRSEGDGAGVRVPAGDRAVPRVSPLGAIPPSPARPSSSSASQGLLAWAPANPPAGSHRSRRNEKGESPHFAPNCPYL